MNMKYIVMVVSVSVIATFGVQGQTYSSDEKLLDALEKKESSRNVYAIGDTNTAYWAFGCLQIRQPCAEDFNTKYGTQILATNLLGDRGTSRRLALGYIGHYATFERLGRVPTDKDKARIWNRGPLGAFDNGAIDKQGTLLKGPKARVRLARRQAEAKQYAAEVARILNPPPKGKLPAESLKLIVRYK